MQHQEHQCRNGSARQARGKKRAVEYCFLCMVIEQFSPASLSELLVVFLYNTRRIPETGNDDVVDILTAAGS